MDRDALIAHLHEALAPLCAAISCQGCIDALDALASDARALEKLKTLCDTTKIRVPIAALDWRSAVLVHQIRAIFGWDATA